MDRPAAYTALYARLKDRVTGVVTFTRRAFTFDQMPALPALEVYATEQVPEQQRGRPTRWTLRAEILLYAQANTNGDIDASADDVLLDLIEQVAAALSWQPGDDGSVAPYTNLGGACQRCWIAGSITFVQGATTDQVIAAIPIELLLA